jgi:16S rRNA (cytosine967-C5)-methyltransferase
MALLKIVSGQNPREIAVQVLGRRRDRIFTEDLLDQALAKIQLPSADRRLCQELVYGVVRWQTALDWLIASKTGNRTQKATLQDLLRLGLYQIFWLDRIPNHAAVHETVELAKHLGFGPQTGFVNAVLRGYLRESDSTRTLLNDLKRNQPSVGYSHPEWLVTRWQARWGAEQTEQLLAWNNAPSKTFARINVLKIDAAKLLPIWRDEKVEYDFVKRDWFEENLVFELKSHPPLGRLASFQQGYFYIQDPSTLLAIHELDPQPGEAVLDLCAAPGGKFTYIAQLMGNQGRLVAHDNDSGRLKLLAANCARLGVTWMGTADLGLPMSSGIPHSALLTPHFGRVLVDAPCSNTGVIRRRVDLRWRVSSLEIERLRKMQLELLRQAVSVLQPKGTIVYSTCSLEPEENRQVMERFLKEHPAFKLEREREVLPFAENLDGAYVAKVKRS